METPTNQILEVRLSGFRIAHEDVSAYRAALGVQGERIPAGMAVRALAEQQVASELKAVAAGRIPIHVSQEYRSHRPLLTDVDYVCDVRLQMIGENRLRVEQSLMDPSGNTCMEAVSEVALVGS